MAEPSKKNSWDLISQGRWSTLGHLVLRMAILLVLFIQVNYLGCRQYGGLDLSRGQKFSLSDRTAGFLKDLNSPARIVTAFLGTSDVLPEIQSIVSEYDRIGGDRVAVETLELGHSRSRDRISALRDRYGLDISRDQIVVISETGRIKVLAAEELVTRNATGRITEFKGEEKITSALLEVTEQQQKKVYLAMGLRRGDQMVAISQKLQNLLQSQNARLEALTLAGRQSIPADADAIVFAGNTTDLTNSELELVRSYWIDRQGGLLLLLDPSARTPNLNSLAITSGVIPQNDRILRQLSVPGLGKKIYYDVPSTTIPGTGPTRELPILSLQLNGRTQSLRVQTQDELYLAENVHPHPLIIAGQGYWGEKEYELDDVVFDPDIDNGPYPLYAAAAIERGQPDDRQLENGAARMVVVGNADLIPPTDNYQKTADDFVMASLNWVMQRDQLLGISPRRPTSFDLAMRDSTFGLLQTLTIWVLPTILLFLGALVWYRRRA